MHTYGYSSFCCCSCWYDLFKQAYGFVVSNQIGMKFGRIVLSVNNHRLTELDWFDVIISRWLPWRHFTHWNVLPPGECTCINSSICPAAASASSWIIVHLYFFSFWKLSARVSCKGKVEKLAIALLAQVRLRPSNTLVSERGMNALHSSYKITTLP